MKCVNCGTEMEESAKFCPKCGQKTEETATVNPKFKRSFFAKVLLVSFIISLVMALGCFGNGNIGAGIVALCQAGLYGTAWLMGRGIIKSKKPRSYIWPAFIGYGLIVVYALATESDSLNSRTEDTRDKNPSYSVETTGSNSPSKEQQMQVNNSQDIISEKQEPEKQKTEKQEQEKHSSLVNGMRPEFKEAMDAYEAFYEEYCVFMKKYSVDSQDMTMLMKYYDLIKKAEEMDRKFEAWDDSDLNDVELAYYIDVTARIQKMLLQVM